VKVEAATVSMAVVWRWIWVRVWVKERAAGAGKERGGGVRLDAEQGRPCVLHRGRHRRCSGGGHEWRRWWGRCFGADGEKTVPCGCDVRGAWPRGGVRTNAM
jgi:hypothetical protein